MKTTSKSKSIEFVNAVKKIPLPGYIFSNTRKTFRTIKWWNISNTNVTQLVKMANLYGCRL